MFSSPSSGILLVLVGFVVARAPAGPWDEFNYAPASRTVWPKAIFKTEGPVVSPELLVANAGATTLSAKGAYVSLDFGLEVRFVKPVLFLPHKRQFSCVDWRYSLANLRRCHHQLERRSRLH